MVKRVSRQSFLYLFFALAVLLASWEHNKALAAVVDADIPQESIRLRILANSDSVQDQALKRQVRDAIVEQMNGWVSGPTTLEEARVIVRERLPELEAVVGEQIRRYGYTYAYQVELGVVPFPAKLYGGKAYPAGDYEAVRVTIGAGEGQNWWCVLFPPLCFVDLAKGEAVAKKDQPKAAAASSAVSSEKEPNGGNTGKSKAGETRDNAHANAENNKKQVEKQSDGKVHDSKSNSGKKAGDGENGDSSGQTDGGKKQVRFFLWEKVKSWFA